MPVDKRSLRLFSVAEPVDKQEVEQFVAPVDRGGEIPAFAGKSDVRDNA